MYTRYFLSFLFVPVFGAFLFPNIISAQTAQEQIDQIQGNREQLQQDIEEAREERKALRDAAVEDRCEIATVRIDNIIAKYNESRLKYVNRYNNLTAKLDNLVSKLDEKQIDTQDLPAMIVEIESRTANFNAQVDVIIAELENSKQYICGQSEGQYLETIQSARLQLIELRSQAVGINQYFTGTVVPELREIKASNQ